LFPQVAHLDLLVMVINVEPCAQITLNRRCPLQEWVVMWEIWVCLREQDPRCFSPLHWFNHFVVQGTGGNDLKRCGLRRVQMGIHLVMSGMHRSDEKTTVTRTISKRLQTQQFFPRNTVSCLLQIQQGTAVGGIFGLHVTVAMYWISKREF